MKILIVEDELNAREFLHKMVSEFIDAEDEVRVSSEVSEALSILKEYPADLILLDIQMPNGTGFELLEKTKEHKFKVIFTTAYDKYALKAIKFSALDYILKPINIDELESSIKRAKNEIEDKNFKIDERLVLQLKENLNKLSKIALPYKNGFVFLNLEEIIYAEADGSYTKIFTTSKEYVASKNIKHFEKLLEDQNFCRIHASYIVNLKQIVSFTKSKGGQVQLSTGKCINVSSSRRKSFFDKVNFS